MLKNVSRSLATVLAAFLVSCHEAPYTTRTIDFEVSEGTNLAFDLSPDGRTIVFDLLGQLWLLPAEGGVARPITDAVRDTADDAGPTFSPDGQWIAFQSDRPGGLGLFRVPVTGGDPERLTRWRRPDARGGSNPAWSPDGRSIAFVFADTLLVFEHADRGAGGNVRAVELEFSEDDRLSLSSVAWSPDGERIAFGTGSGGVFLPFPGQYGTGVWEVATTGGAAHRVTPEGIRAVSPAFSPDGVEIAFFARDSVEAWHLWVQGYPDGPARQLTDQPGVAVRRVRWTRSGRELVYAADGRLWRIAASGGEPSEIPFTARVRFERRTPHLPPVRFPQPGTEQRLRGFEGIALSPDGRRIAMIALEKLWVWSVGDPASAVTDLPVGATSPSWSDNGTEIAFSVGDLFVANAEKGTVRRLTSFEGRIEFPVWSPDGRHIAFVHGRECDPSGNCSGGTLRLIDPQASATGDVTHTVSLGNVPAMSHPPAWRPDSKALLAYDAYLPQNNARLFYLSGVTRDLEAFPTAATFLAWVAPDSVLFIRRNVLWRAFFDETSGEFGSPIALTDHAAMYPSVAASGDVLYVSGGGLRHRTAAGESVTLGWPATFQVPAAPPALLIRNVRVIDGRGGAPSESRDILIEDGRIARISATEMREVAQGVSVLDAGGRTVIPGFIDTHQHFASRKNGDLRMLGGLYFGNTTIRDAGSSLAQIADQRDLVVAGGLPGTRLAVSGVLFHGDIGPPWPVGLTDPFNQFVVDSIDMARGVDLVRAFGADYVKHRGYFNWASLVTLIGEAHGHGVQISGHCTATLVAVAAGADGQEHTAQCWRDFNRVHEDFARLKAAAGMWVTTNPAMSRTSIMDRDEPTWRYRPDIAGFLLATDTASYLRGPPMSREELVRFHLRWRSQTTALHDFGVDLAVGTDDGLLPNVTQITLRTLVDAGMTPLEAITTATLAAARVVGAEADIGSIEVGKLADLVILEADPLEDIANTERIWRVLKGGVVVDREALLRLASERGGGLR